MAGLQVDASITVRFLDSKEILEEGFLANERLVISVVTSSGDSALKEDEAGRLTTKSEAIHQLLSMLLVHRHGDTMRMASHPKGCLMMVLMMRMMRGRHDDTAKSTAATGAEHG